VTVSETTERRLRQSRELGQRLVITGTLQLLTPAQLGNGDAEALTDMPLLRDPLDGTPLLTGTTVAGALRAYLFTRIAGYGVAAQPQDTATPGWCRLVTRLFGGSKGDDQGGQSALIVDDAYGRTPAAIALEVRDGVKIDYSTHTADDKKKYDLELLPAGTTFDLRLELLLPADQTVATDLRRALAVALSGFAAEEEKKYGAIMIGARRTRGFGRCVVEQWTFTQYDLHSPAGLVAWLAADHDWAYTPSRVWHGGPYDLLEGAANGASAEPFDARRAFRIVASFDLASSLLVRSGEPLTNAGDQPDATQIRSYRPESQPAYAEATHLPPAAGAPVLPGTSLAGALRSRATRILNSLPGVDSQRREQLLDFVFGRDAHRNNGKDEIDADLTMSRLVVDEAIVEGGRPLVQNRVSIDRFTGGAFDTALFAEAPHVGGSVALALTLQLNGDAPSTEAEETREHAAIGLLLLLLKDLWTGDLPLGGTSAVGRGRLLGRSAQLAFVNDAKARQWRIVATQDDGQIVFEAGQADELQTFVDELQRYLEVQWHA
jgi:CRISPR/Cas system CMR subunit Cmr4 (Cas7 group RAMP superfamily)